VLDIKGYYAIMEVSEHANYREIRSAFRRLAKKYHPDLNNSEQAEEMIKKINVAFEVLSDKEKRREYDSICFNDNNYLPKQKEENNNENENNKSRINNADKYSKSRKEDEDNSAIPSGYQSVYFNFYNDSARDEAGNHNSRKNIRQRIGQHSVVSTDTSNVNTKSRFQIIVEPSLCMAFGSCETLAPKVFAVEKDKIFNPKAKVISEIEDLDVILAAAQTCPTKAILIKDRKTGDYIYP
jgi:DnaJ-class molecular chaperone/ferredoxin